LVKKVIDNKYCLRYQKVHIRNNNFFKILAKYFLDKFFEGGFSAEKRPSTFELWRVSVDGLESVPVDKAT
jgi:hypothetical protein